MSPDPKRNWKVWRVYGPETTTYWVVVDEFTSAREYAKDCPPNTAFAVHGTMQSITRFRAEKILACFATDYGKGK
jgi:hypothetical protein